MIYTINIGNPVATQCIASMFTHAYKRLRITSKEIYITENLLSFKCNICIYWKIYLPLWRFIV